MLVNVNFAPGSRLEQANVSEFTKSLPFSYLVAPISPRAAKGPVSDGHPTLSVVRTISE